jgi:hypothetical protein
MIGFTAIGCAAGPYTCVAAVAAVAITTAVAAIDNGAPVGPTLFNAGWTIALSYIGLAGGAAIGEGLNSGANGQFIGNLTTSLSTSALNSVAYDRDNLGKNLVVSCTAAAGSFAIGQAFAGSTPVSDADTAEADGSGGSAEAQVERAETLDSILAEGGFGHHVDATEWYINTGAGGNAIVAEGDAFDFRARVGFGFRWGPVSVFGGVSIDNTGDVSLVGESSASVNPMRPPSYRLRLKLFDLQNNLNSPGFRYSESIKYTYGMFSFSQSGGRLRGGIEFPGGWDLATDQISTSLAAQGKGEYDLHLFNVTTPFRAAADYVTGVVGQPMLDYFGMPR